MHGLGGHAAVFRPLAEALDEGRAVYGLQALGLDAGQTAHDCIEAMAEHYVRELRTVQPRGPYLLAGWSLGGLTALEAARQLSADGESVELVALLDTYLSLSDLLGRRLDEQVALRWLAPHLNLSVAKLKKLPLDRQWDLVIEHARTSLGIAQPEIERLAAVCRAQLVAAGRYRPQPYAGSVVLFRAGRARGFPGRRWRALCQRLHTEQVPGNHYSMLQQPQVAVLAQRLDAQLRTRQESRN
jgi:thioesterase domain-containing protein